MLDKLLNLIYSAAKLPFAQASMQLDKEISSLSKKDFIALLNHIGIIPESIEHDSTEEKLFSKASDSVLARAFREIGLRATVLDERGDSADVVVKSNIYEYELVADAKAFRLSRTAKNQKDFKVNALSGWRKDRDFAVLASPYFQYPNTRSQIYKQAIDHNVCLLTWEHLSFLIEQNITETIERNLSDLWDYSAIYAKECLSSETKRCFIPKFNDYFAQFLEIEADKFETYLQKQKERIAQQGKVEIAFWQEEEQKIRAFSREKAIEELLKTKKITNKISTIKQYIAGLFI
ncbi:Type-2 restriction enzyme HindIII [Kingella potus]|uniref:Type-2 restriction enzyme HindIII n=1 Tax=Kingella potus TaxID=265175 RepID=A0A377R1W7_9NEIS|nr:HindIII family type II restriction endonuclease [Kingella potus]UOP00444.1 HindIII family type II restriction endonuclease [Kingella potus]STR02491.1 Type-2 restriction enzyme HindIII [Kingella potus]